MQTLGKYEAHYPTNLLSLLLTSAWNEISVLWLERQMPITGLWILTLGAQYVVRLGRIIEPSRYGAQLQEVCCGCELWECRCTLLCVVEMWPLNFLLLVPCSPAPTLQPPLWTYNPQELQVHELFFNFIMEFYQSNRKVTNTVMSLPEPSETEFTHIQQVQKQSPYEYLWLVIRQ